MAKNQRGVPLEEVRLQNQLEALATEIENIVEREVVLARLRKLADDTEALIPKPKK